MRLQPTTTNQNVFHRMSVMSNREDAVLLHLKKKKNAHKTRIFSQAASKAFADIVFKAGTTTAAAAELHGVA